MPKVYIAGKMTGMPDYNFPAFDRARDALLRLGYTVVSPADEDRAVGFTGEGIATDKFRQDAMQRDIVALAECDFIYLLEGWQSSPGATLEYSYATYVGIPLLNPPRILGLSGYATAGKDTLAEFLVEDYGYTRIAFADALKRIAYQCNPGLATGVDVKGWTVAKQSPLVRKFLQDLGVSVRDVMGPDTWVDVAFRHVEPGQRYVITDLRFPSELDRIRSYPGSLTVWVERPGVGPVNDHISERGLKDAKLDLTVQNSGTIYDLKRVAEDIVREHERRADAGRGTT